MQPSNTKKSLTNQTQETTRTSTTQMPFEYQQKFEIKLSNDCHTLNIPANIKTKEDLLLILSKEGKFPNYFGFNWDALHDCLRDLSWITNYQVVIQHHDIPLLNKIDDCQTYLEILQSAIIDWKKTPQNNTNKNPQANKCIAHELRAIFPTEHESKIAQIAKFSPT